MSQSLRVVTAFGPFAVDQIIADPAQVALILAGKNAADVVDAATGSGGSGSAGGSTGSGTGTSSGTGLAPVSYALSGVTAYTATHSFPYLPRVWLIDAFGAEVETDVSYAGSQVLLSFPTPFTGTLWLG